MGLRAGEDITNGLYNVLFGRNAAKGLTTGCWNVAIGSGALGGGSDTTVTGSNNIAIGQALPRITSGKCNVAIGHCSGKCTASGEYNIFFGSYAGACAVESDCNIAIGYAAGMNLKNSGNNCHNIFIGKAAGHGGAAGNEGNHNTFVGYQAGCDITEGYSNVIVGVNAGIALTSGFNNTLVGPSAGKLLTSSEYNTAIGHCAANAMSSGGRSTFIGYYGGGEADYACYSFLYGFKSGPSVSPKCSTYDIFMGGHAGCCLSTSCRNIVIGQGHRGAHLVANGACQLSIGIESCYWISGDSSFNVKTRTITPTTTDTYNLGSGSLRWANIYTNDLQLSNESKKDTGGNDVDGTWGDWTLQEGENDIFMINNRTGKKFKINMTEVL